MDLVPRETPTTTIFDLSPELRLIIYKYFLSSIKAYFHVKFYPVADHWQHYPEKPSKRATAYLPLLLTHPLFNKEAAPLVQKIVSFEMASCVCVPPDATNISVLPRLQYLTLPSARSFEEDGRFLSSLVTTVKHRFGEDFRFTRLDCRQNFDISVYEQARKHADIIKELRGIACELSFGIYTHMEGYYVMSAEVSGRSDGMTAIRPRRLEQQLQVTAAIAKEYLVRFGVFEAEKIDIGKAEEYLEKTPAAREKVDQHVLRMPMSS